MKSKALLLLFTLLLTGCVKRQILVSSDPPGARVQINGRDAGVTPITYDFIAHGRYAITVSKPGFREISVREPVRAPWHQWIPLDFFTELLIPVQFDDTHRFYYALEPATPSERMAREPAPAIEDLVIRLRGASDPGRRREACIQMARYHLVEGVPTLQEAVRDPHPEVRSAALQTLRVLTGPEAVPVLVAALREDRVASVRWQAAAELEVLKAAEAVPALLASLNDRDAVVRAAAVEALRAIGQQQVAPAVGKRLGDNDVVVRRSAADALGRLGDGRISPVLSKALRDPDPEVRRRAAKSLLKLRASQESRALAGALRDRDPKVRATMVEALTQFGTPEAVPVAMRYVRAWSAATRESAARALGGLKDQRAVPVLERSVRREPNPYTRLAMAEALVGLGAWPASRVTDYAVPPPPAKETK